jgi:trimeric autotransporter adhesin
MKAALLFLLASMMVIAPHAPHGQVLLQQPNLTMDGIVKATAIDSRGRVVFGGTFTHVNGQPLSRLARLNTDLTLDTTWNPNVVGDSSVANGVYVISSYGGSIYFGGAFTQVGSISRNALAAVDEESGALTDWNPNVLGDQDGLHGTVNSLVIENNTIYLGGYFYSVGGQQRNNLGAVDPIQGAANDWNPNPDGPMFSMTAASDGKIYVVGDFGYLGNSRFSGIAAIDPNTGLPSS